MLFMQHIALQNISLAGITTTYTEVNLYFHERDARLAFDTLFDSFTIENTQEPITIPS